MSLAGCSQLIAFGVKSSKQSLEVSACTKILPTKINGCAHGCRYKGDEGFPSMKKRMNWWWNSSKEVATSRAEQALKHTCAGRVVSALTFIVVVFCLGMWITVFLLLKDRLFTQAFSGNLLTNLTCIVFFGGLVVAFFVGALAGNFLRRAFWKILVERFK
jgi:hypothetical protein